MFPFSVPEIQTNMKQGYLSLVLVKNSVLQTQLGIIEKVFVPCIFSSLHTEFHCLSIDMEYLGGGEYTRVSHLLESGLHKRSF
jgi:hypothetical protein